MSAEQNEQPAVCPVCKNKKQWWCVSCDGTDPRLDADLAELDPARRRLRLASLERSPAGGSAFECSDWLGELEAALRYAKDKMALAIEKHDEELHEYWFGYYNCLLWVREKSKRRRSPSEGGCAASRGEAPARPSPAAGCAEARDRLTNP